MCASRGIGREKVIERDRQTEREREGKRERNNEKWRERKKKDERVSECESEKYVRKVKRVFVLSLPPAVGTSKLSLF